METRKKILTVTLFTLLSLGGCVTAPTSGVITIPANLEALTTTGTVLSLLPPPKVPLDVAVYRFNDLTGKNKPSDDFAQYSRAVTQGGASILVDVLKEAGYGKWFEVVEREGIDSLLRERDLIQRTRIAFQGPKAEPVPALRFAGILLEGGIVGYDSNETTGGVGARALGIGGAIQYRRDVVTVALRAVSVQSGRVLTSVTTTKTIYSILLEGGTFRFVALTDILEAEAGVSHNEPEQIATREAIELAVYSLIVQGAKGGLWEFENLEQARQVIRDYEARYRNRMISATG